MNRFKEYFQSKRAKMLIMATAIMSSLSVFCFASELESPDVKTIMTTALTKVIADCTSLLASMLPVALTLVGIGLAIQFGLKWFRKITAKA